MGETYLCWAWKNLMRLCRKSGPCFIWLSPAFSRYCGEGAGGQDVPREQKLNPWDKGLQPLSQANPLGHD